MSVVSFISLKYKSSIKFTARQESLDVCAKKCLEFFMATENWNLKLRMTVLWVITVKTKSSVDPEHYKLFRSYCSRQKGDIGVVKRGELPRGGGIIYNVHFIVDCECHQKVYPHENFQLNTYKFITSTILVLKEVYLNNGQ